MSTKVRSQTPSLAEQKKQAERTRDQLKFQKQLKGQQRHLGAERMASISDRQEKADMAGMMTTLDEEITELARGIAHQDLIIKRLAAQIRIPEAERELAEVENVGKLLGGDITRIGKLCTELGRELGLYGEHAEALYKLVGHGLPDSVQRQGHHLFVHQIKSRVRFSLFFGWPDWIRREFVRVNIPAYRRSFVEQETVVIDAVMQAAREEVRKLDQIANSKEE
jgi:hypothetical protein